MIYCTSFENQTSSSFQDEHQERMDTANCLFIEAIEKLSSKIDSFEEQLRENSLLVANISKLVSYF